MMWPKRATPVLPDDSGMARKLRDQSRQDLENLKSQAEEVSSLAGRLIEKRKANNFGDSIQITFTPRGKHV